MAADDGPAPPVGRRPQRKRLSRSAEFERVYRQGKSHGNRHLVVHAFPRGAGPAGATESVGADAEGPRLGLSVSKRVGNAVERNLVKRLVREAFAAEADRVGPEQDIVVVARPPALELAQRDGLPGVSAALGELLDKIAPKPPEA